MKKSEKSCTNCKHYATYFGGTSVCNKFNKYALIARMHDCVDNAEWQRIPSPRKVKQQ